MLTHAYDYYYYYFLPELDMIPQVIKKINCPETEKWAMSLWLIQFKHNEGTMKSDVIEALDVVIIIIIMCLLSRTI